LVPKRTQLVPKRLVYFIYEGILNTRGDHAFLYGCRKRQNEKCRKKCRNGWTPSHIVFHILPTGILIHHSLIYIPSLLAVKFNKVESERVRASLFTGSLFSWDIRILPLQPLQINLNFLFDLKPPLALTDWIQGFDQESNWSGT
jgi:hypothetical protein